MWTQEDLNEVNRAIRDLATGKRLVKISFTTDEGFQQSNEYAQTELPQLRALKQEIEKELSSDCDYYVKSSKGLF